MTNSIVTTDKVPRKTKDKNVDEKCIAFGRRLQSAIEDAELTQAEVARLMEVSRSAVNWWIQGQTYPSVEKAERLADILRVTPEYLIYGVIHSKKDRLIENIPVYDTNIRGIQHNISQLGIPKDFIARTMPHAGNLKGISIKALDKTIITIADTADREITDEPKTMLVDFGEDGHGNVKAVELHKSDRSILIDVPGNGRLMMSEGDFRKQNLVIGHVVAELHTTGRA